MKHNIEQNRTIVALISEVDKLILELNETIKRQQPSLNTQRFITDAQLTEILHTNRRTTGEWRRDGVLPYYKIGGRILYLESEVQDMVARHRLPPIK